MFICGSGSCRHQGEEDQNESYNTTPCTTPKRSKKSNSTSSFCKIIGKDNTTNKNINPYADRGLDKFYALLADLDNKKQQIYTQKGGEDISLVRFVYTNDSKAFKPIVVRAKDKNKKVVDQNMMLYSTTPKVVKHDAHVSDEKDQNAINPDQSSDIVAEPKDQHKLEEDINIEKKKKKKRCLRSCDGISFRLDNLRKPNYYFFVILVLILLFMAMFGRSFAIMFTSIGWYLIPTITQGRSSSSSSTNEITRRPKRKKEYVKKLSHEKKINHVNVHSQGGSSPTSVLTNDKSQQLNGHRKSW